MCDNESKIDIIKNQEMITNIRKTRNPIALPGIGGEPMRIVLEGDLVGYGTAYHHPKIAANKFSFYRMTNNSNQFGIIILKRIRLWSQEMMTL